MRILTPTQVRALDHRAIADLGLPAAVLMETAGRAIAREIANRLGSATDRHATILAGVGNNGGDGFVAGRVLHRLGYRVECWLAGDPGKMTPETALHFQAMQGTGVLVHPVPRPPVGQELTALRRQLGRSAAIVDALAGTGLHGDLREPVRTLAAQLDGRYRALTVAADVPSGLDADTGQVLGAAVRCHLVVTMAAGKPGLFLGQGPALWDEVVVADIGIPPAWLAEQAPQGSTLDVRTLRPLLPDRPDEGHKGRFGHLLVAAGSPGKAGAALLCTGAALRSGVGLCTLATAGEVRQRLEAWSPDVMVEAIGGGAGEIERVDELLQKKAAVVAGPGLGTGAAEVALVGRLLTATEAPVLLDADALTCLSRQHGLARPAAGRLVLTPHPGEMARLLDREIPAIEADRLGAAREVAQKFQAVVVLKGHRTLVVAPDGRWAVATQPNPALAKGGTGDVLAGVIGSLLAQGLPPFDAARLGVLAHALAGWALKAQWGQRAGLASDLVDHLATAWRGLEDPAHLPADLPVRLRGTPEHV